MDLFNNDNGAEFSECGKYRYRLWRIWDESKPLVMFIGLNPSTANATSDDPTIRRVKTIASNLGFGGFYMMNVFPYISTDPKKLIVSGCWESDITNSDHLRMVGCFCKEIIFAWGNFKEVEKRHIDAMISIFPNAKALHINKNGSPKHPLYCKSDIQPVLFKTQIQIK